MTNNKGEIKFNFNLLFYSQIKDVLPKHKLLVFTGPIDAYFASQGLPKLEYRSIIFEVKSLSYIFW